MIDIDTGGPGGISATPSERKAAKEIADAVYEDLRRAGWPEPAFVDTGNGYTLYFGVDLPAEDDGLIRRVLESLASKFGNDAAHVDTVVHDAVRLARLPGTKNCKGDEVGDRKHRFCRVIRWPSGPLAPVSRELLEQLAAQAPAPKRSTKPTNPAGDTVIAQARAHIAKMPAAISGQHGHNVTFSVACRLVIDFDLSPDQAMPLMLEYNARCEPPWTEAELRRKLEEANRLDVPRGRLRFGDVRVSDFLANAEPLTGSEFHGHVPDFADAAQADVLAVFETYERRNRDRGDLPGLFLVWQMQRSDVAIPDVWLRQFVWGGSWPKNWRRDLREMLKCQTAFKHPTRCKLRRQVCPLSGTNVRHQHFDRGKKVKYGLLETFAELASENGHRIFRLHDVAYEEEKMEMRKTGRLIQAYWLGWLFGASPRIGWDFFQQRMLQGIVYELTRLHDRKHGQHIITEGKVITAGKGKHLVACPLLDPHRAYVVFGGNGCRPGRGYKIVGDTRRGWLRRTGFVGYLSSRSNINLAISMLLRTLDTFASDLDLVVAAYHGKKREWKGISELKACLRSGVGRDWLEECTLRIFAPEDWLLRWRYFFSRKMGFRWIPASVDDRGPFAEARDVNPRDTPLPSGEVIRDWLQGMDWTQQDLAEKLGCSRRRVSRHLTGERQTSAFADDVAALMRRKG